MVRGGGRDSERVGVRQMGWGQGGWGWKCIGQRGSRGGTLTVLLLLLLLPKGLEAVEASTLEGLGLCKPELPA